jgi:hypothetical protein
MNFQLTTARARVLTLNRPIDYREASSRAVQPLIEAGLYTYDKTTGLYTLNARGEAVRAHIEALAEMGFTL